jgi:hypothetical protein
MSKKNPVNNLGCQSATRRALQSNDESPPNLLAEPRATGVLIAFGIQCLGSRRLCPSPRLGRLQAEICYDWLTKSLRCCGIRAMTQVCASGRGWSPAVSGLQAVCCFSRSNEVLGSSILVALLGGVQRVVQEPTAMTPLADCSPKPPSVCYVLLTELECSLL